MKDSVILKQYIQSIAKCPRITPDEEIELALRIRKGDQVALDKMVNSNLKLVVKISMEMCKGNSSIMDIIQNGNLGLIRAAKKFNPDHEVRFSTYSAFWIKQSILRGFIKPSLNVSISYRKDEINKRVKSFIRDYFSDNGKLPLVDDIVYNLKVKRRDAIDVLLLFKTSGDLLSFNNMEANEDVLDNFQDYSLSPERIVESQIMEKDIIHAIESFPNRVRDIIKSRFGFNNEKKETLQDLGDKYDISAEATRQIERKVLTMMRVKFPALAYYFYAA
jgi:RNA polymerase sigma factor (sigma-70 family)